MSMCDVQYFILIATYKTKRQMIILIWKYLKPQMN